jgi:peroxiredoxin
LINLSQTNSRLSRTIATVPGAMLYSKPRTPNSLASRRIAPVAIVAMIFAASATSAVWAADSAPEGGKQVGQFSLGDAKGAQHTADEWRQSKAIVLFFIDTECPVSNGYAPDMQRIADKYVARGVKCYGIHCEESTTAAIAGKHAREYSLAFPILLDPAMTLAQAVAARVTPEAVVVSPAGSVLYQGRIDDRYASDGKRRDEPTARDLEDALAAVLAGKQPAVKVTKAYGCPLPTPKAGAR